MAKDEIFCYAKTIFSEYETFRINNFQNRSFSPDVVYSIINKLVVDSDNRFGIYNAGLSFEGRPIQFVEVGRGETIVLLWSQMHGDESTATMALCDILNCLLLSKDNAVTDKILSSIKLLFLPMLNPDGAVRFQRRTAQGIDMNRDALALVTPEARILKQMHKEFKPKFGFNLHDQELSTVGSTNELAAIGLLAPSTDHEKTDSEARLRSKQLASLFAETMNLLIPNKVTKYDDNFEPRAFGDNMQKWGTSTLLVESGHFIDDPKKDLIRRLNFVGILSSLYAIATGDDKNFDTAAYENLPVNSKRAYDVIIRDVFIVNKNGNKIKADLGISYQVDSHSELPPKLVDVGDLHTFIGVKEIDGKGIAISQDTLRLNEVFEWENILSL